MKLGDPQVIKISQVNGEAAQKWLKDIRGSQKNTGLVVLSVLAVLSESERSTAIAALSIAGTSLVLFFAQVYAGSVAERIRLGREPGFGGSASARSRQLAGGRSGLMAAGVTRAGRSRCHGDRDRDRAGDVAGRCGAGVWGWRAGQIGHSQVIGRLWSTALTSPSGWSS
jgi:hypothetical protein